MALLLAGVVAAPAGAAYDPAAEQRNYAKIDERSRVEFSDPAFQAELRTRGIERQAETERIRATDPERDFSGNLCSRPQDGCAGDFRLYDWAAQGHGLRTNVLYTARNGSTISGHLWMTAEGPARRPAIVITSGSVQAPETTYWGQAATLAKKGYVVLTWDAQGQGLSDTYGEGADRNDGVPSQEGRPFYDGTEDALDFLLSTPERPYVPRPSCTSGTSHAPKQARRVQEGYNAAFNPLWRLTDASRVGIAGHSLGAAAVSYVGQADPRVKAIVAWDNLREPTAPGKACGGVARPGVPITKPALGISNDYGLFRQPITGEPDPAGRAQASAAYSAAGVDTGQLNVRGGTHYEPSYIPNHYFSASLRGIDLTAWYTGAFFDRYVKGDVAGGERRLLTDRWRADARGAEVDPAGDGNLLSFYFRSRLDVGRGGGTRLVCEDVRTGCPGLVAGGADGAPPGYGYLAEARTPDAGPGPAGAAPPPRPADVISAPPSSRRCASRRTVLVRLRAPRGERIRRVSVKVGRRTARVDRGKRLRRVRVSLRGLPRGRYRVRIRATTARGRSFTLVRTYRTCAPKRR